MNLNCWLLIDKPIGKTSFFVVNYLKKILNVKKIGHGGTLDPLASGMLPIAIGEATKTLNFVMNKPKTYRFTIQFGKSTTTFDQEGDTVESNDIMPTKEQLLKTINNFIGEIEQTPPIFSAIKVNGQRAYDLARKNKDFTLQSRKVTIYDLKLNDYNYEHKQATFTAKVSKGTYIRSLGVDIAKSVNAISYVLELRRLSIASFKEKSLLKLDKLYNNCNLALVYAISIEDVLDDILGIEFNLEEANNILQGKKIFISDQRVNTTKKQTESIENSTVYKALYLDKVISLFTLENGLTKVLRNFNHVNVT